MLKSGEHPWVGEHRIGVASFNQSSQMEKRCELRYASSLLHRVGNDDDAIVLAQIIDQLFDASGGDGIKC